MKLILALETTEKFGSVAMLDGEQVLRESTLPTTDRSAKTLAPALDRLLMEEHCDPNDIETVAVVVGPGSFTGLRVGVATAKMFAYAIGASVVAVDTFETIAAGAVAAGLPLDREQARFLTVGVDAQRGDVVYQTFELTPTGAKPISPSELCSVDQWWRLRQTMPDIMFTGPALERFKTKMPSGVQVVAETSWNPRASVAGQIAAKRVAAGTINDLWNLLPIYSRLSAAEERSAGRSG